MQDLPSVPGGNGDDVWWVAIALIVLQTSRHMSDYDFARIQKTREAQAPRADIRDPSDPLPEGEGRLAGAVQVSARVNRRSAIPVDEEDPAHADRRALAAVECSQRCGRTQVGAHRITDCRWRCTDVRG